MADSPVLTEKERIRLEKKKEKEALKAAKIAKAKAKEEARKKAEQDASTKPKKEKEKKARKDKQEDEPFVNITPPGDKKDMSQPMRNSYDPTAVEAAHYDWWMKKGYFHADNTSTKENFVMVIPPPNVTGSLHLGHALTNSVQDTIVRWNRMNGKNTLWVPGTDHAGIATQVVVEKKLQREQNVSRHDLGREKFVEEVWKWKGDYGGRIVNQLKRLGSSLDWDREVFTMDEKLSRAVTEAFVRLHEEGLIYRDNRLVNWCCKLNTAISDIEVDHIELEGHTKMKIPGYGNKEYDFGVLIDFAYQVENSKAELVVSTTRPETMLGDTAVAVHPDDPRYKHLHGLFLVHPFNGRRIPIVTDDKLVIMEFGTGAVKVTPAHDPNDYECGKRHNLPFINILNDDGTFNDNATPFQGMSRFDAREAVVQALKDKGLYRGMSSNPMTIGICSRSKDIIEPVLKPQWWVNCQSMAQQAAAVVESGELEIVPPMHRDTWFRWLGDIRDWCISRQLWWGHRCPAYLVSVEGQELDSNENQNWIVARSEEEARRLAIAKFPNVSPEKIRLEQDPDVLDTWFSSALFPFSVMGWPEDTADMKAFYPTSLLETGHDILFFWVVRMVMLGLQLCKRLPFRQVLLHAMVRDAHGRKMSKSLGNVIDPLDMIKGITLEELHEKLKDGNLDPAEMERAKEGQRRDFPAGIPECGTDALRFALCAYTTQGRDINLDVNRVVAYRNFCNKLWNATKFALLNLGTDFQPADVAPTTGHSVWDQWILSRLQTAIRSSIAGFQRYDFAQVTTAIYNFWLYDLCDVYLESLKPVMQGSDTTRQQASREILYTCLDNGLRLLHPFMPFVTEELYQRLNRRKSEDYESIMITPYPNEVPSWENPEVEKYAKFSMDIIHAARAMRASFGLTKQRPEMMVNFHTASLVDEMAPYVETITFLSRTENTKLVFDRPTPEGCAVEIVNDSCEVYLMIKGHVDISSEIQKLEKKKGKLEADIAKMVKQMEGPHYHKVPEKLKGENSEKLAALRQELEVSTKTIQGFKKFM